MGKAIIELDNKLHSFYFNIYQSRSGLIYLVLGDSVISLTLEQVNELEKSVNLKQLLGFDVNAFKNAYGGVKNEWRRKKKCIGKFQCG